MTSTAKKATAKKVAKVSAADTAKAKAEKADAQKVTATLRARAEANETDRGALLFDAAGEFHRIVVKQGTLKQGAFADQIYGKRDSKGQIVAGSSGAWSTILKRLSDARMRLGIEHGSVEWRYLVQKGGTGPAGTALLNPPAKARKALASVAKQWDTTGKVQGNSRKPGGTQSQTDKDTKKVTTDQEVLAALQKYLDKMPADKVGPFANRVRTMLTATEQARAAKGSNRSPRTGQATGTDG